MAQHNAMVITLFLSLCQNFSVLKYVYICINKPVNVLVLVLASGIG